MIALLRFVASNAWVISLFCLLGAGRYAWKAFTLRRAGTVTPYALERESSVDQTARAWVTAAILAALGLVVLIISPLIVWSTGDRVSEAPATLVAGILTKTPAPVTPATSTPAPAPVEGTPTPPLATSAPAVTVRPADTPTPEATPSAVPLPPNCPDPGVQLSSPSAGQTLSGGLEVRGTANVPDFDFYKFEINGPLTHGDWWTLGDLARTPVHQGVLGYWDAGPVARDAPGLYLFRLVVVDRTGNYPAPCVVQVRIE